MSDDNERSVASDGSEAGDKDILTRLRDWRSVHLARLHELMSEAADEIERLRALADERGTIAVNRRREIERLRLTDAERCAIIAGLRCLERQLWADPENLGGDYRDLQRDAATLRGLLNRLYPIKTAECDRPQPIDTPNQQPTPGEGSLRNGCVSGRETVR